ncbi:hypothetical protein EYF80_001234 [Liparis tanakae]|uniref:Uncharacterized protein n=1 Tax=Liparis tanakae TaxID=230148 RepID=A0A4Z2JGT4_9TELE|nr:hypothetical protein EYF80_001234 [Liparis tanakae]
MVCYDIHRKAPGMGSGSPLQKTQLAVRLPPITLTPADFHMTGSSSRTHQRPAPVQRTSVPECRVPEQTLGQRMLTGELKGNRCAVMSTVDYSCNIARKCAPPRLGHGLSVEPGLLSILPDEQLLLGRYNRGVGSFLFSTADRDTVRLVHTHFWSTLYCCPSPFKRRQRSAYALSVLVE